MKQQQKCKNVFYADSGATDHMSFQRELFEMVNNFKTGGYFVKVGDGRKLTVEGIGDIIVRSDVSGSTHTIKDVLLVPDLDKNFISVSRATEKGMDVIFKEGGNRVCFMKSNNVIIYGTRESGLYKMNLKPLSASLNVAVADSIKIWHERLGHVNYKTLREMVNNKTVDGLSVKNSHNYEILPFCEGCAYGKQHRNSFPRDQARRATKPGEVFHVDLCGKMSVPSINGANYFMLLKDDYSRFCFIYFLKNKTDVLTNLMTFYADVRSDGHDIRKLRSDGGLEFCNDSVRKFLLQHGIKHELSTPRAPEQNGFIERQNRTVVESAKSMLHAKNLPTYLWAEATNTAVYLKNRTASDVIGGCTPYEKWYGKKPVVNYLRIFGSEAFVHIPKEQRTKFEKNSVKYILVGYNDSSKAYRVYDPKSKKVFIRRDVIFNEKYGEYINEIIEMKTKHENKNVNENVNDEVVDCNEEESKQQESEVPVDNNYMFAGEQKFKNPYNTRSSKKKNNNEVNSEVCSVQLEPTTLEEALEGEESQMWNLAIRDELNSLYENDTWILVPRTPNMHIITNRWIFKRKYKSDGKIDKYKARLVVRGCSQKRGVDYDEIYSPVVRHESVRLLLSIAAAFDMFIYQFDVKTAFLHGMLEEVIYMEQPYGYEQDERVCKLQKGLYGLKQASRQWNKRIVNFLSDFGFIQSSADLCVFYYNSEQITTFLALYVDDGLVCGNNLSYIVDLLKTLNCEFNITFGPAESFVGIQIETCRKTMKLKIHQRAYVNRILKRFNHDNCAVVSTPAEPGMKFSKLSTKSQEKFPYREAIGSLMYLMVSTRPDISFSVGILSRFVENPSQTHCNGVKRIFKYLKGTDDKGLSYDIGSRCNMLKMYCDADWAGDLDSRRSTTGWIATINDGPIAWSSKKQTVTATSTTEAEFLALCAATKTVVWLRKLIKSIGIVIPDATPVKCDNQQAITLVKSPESSKRTKHIDTQYFYTCDIQAKGEIDVQYLESVNQPADILTKALSKERFRSLLNLLKI